nr:unnamed protein product [Callosobruchus analis]
MESRFNERITQIANSMAPSIYFMTKSTYCRLLHTVKTIGSNRPGCQKDTERRLLRRIAVETISGKETLITCKQFHPIQVPTHGRTLRSIHKVHIITKHGAKDIMLPLLRKEYMNVAMVCQRTKVSPREKRRSSFLDSDELVLDLYIMDKPPFQPIYSRNEFMFNLRLRELVDISELQGQGILTSSDVSEDTPHILKYYIYLNRLLHNTRLPYIIRAWRENQNINTDMVTLYMEICCFCLNKHAAYNQVLITQPPLTIKENRQDAYQLIYMKKMNAELLCMIITRVSSRNRG